MMKRTVAALCIDVETTGLSLEDDLILEVGMVALDEQLEVIDSFQAVVCGPAERFRLHEIAAAAQRGDSGARIVTNMHISNGLAQLVEDGKGTSLEEAQRLACGFVDRLAAAGLPMMGSSVHFDRNMLAKHMPDLEAKFHYRNLDVSSIKNWINLRGDLAVLGELEKLKNDRSEARGLHRSVSDCIDTRDELRRYTEVLMP